MLVLTDGGIWPSDGEIDCPEGNLTGMILGFSHHQGGVFPADQAALTTSVPDTGGVAHRDADLAVERRHSTAGRAERRHDTAPAPNTPMDLVIQTEASTDGTVPADSAAGNFQIDWLAVYTPA